MPVDDVRFVIASLAYGAVVGWGLGRRPEHRRPATWATAVAAAGGAAAWGAWYLADAPGRSLGTAAVALSFGGAVAVVVLLTTGRRPGR